MHSAPLSLDPQTLSKLAGLQLRARYIVDGYLSGMHRSAHYGQSVEFTEHREYSQGDDLRYVDWKVYGKTDKVYLKRFEAETNLVCYLLVDVSESMSYQSEGVALSKSQYAHCLAAALASLVLRQRDSVSLMTFDQDVRELVRASGNPAHWHQLVEVLERSRLERKSSLGKVLHEISQRLRCPGLVVVFSDLLGDTDSLISGLKHLRHDRHELLVLHLLDPAEVEFPFEHATRFRGLERLSSVLTEPRGVRQAYLKELAQFVGRVEAACRSMQADYELLRSDESFGLSLERVLTKRRGGLRR
ncbi:MAG: DUF58 domain-containing protein [Pirellulales bacterium]|nr:DUF58 domain-containing protein [Pirellulales bacterium]